MRKFEDSETTLIADVDCTAAGKKICKKVGVKSYPTLKYGDPNNLEKYEGGRAYKDLLKFAKENLGPACGPAKMDLCDDEQKAKIELLMAKGIEQLTVEIEKLEARIQSAEDHFEKEVNKLTDRYEEIEKDKNDTIAAAKDKDLGLMKSVRDSLEAEAAKHDEL